MKASLSQFQKPLKVNLKMADNLLQLYFEEIKKLIEENPNDMDLGKKIRELFNSLPEHLK